MSDQEPKEKDWQPLDKIILIVTIIIGFTIVSSIIRPLITHRDVSAEGAKLISSILGSLISIVSIYVGSKLKK